MSVRSIVKKVSRILPDKAYISLKYLMRFGKFPDLKDPKTFNEKLQWLKLHDRKPVYTTMVDKYEVKKYVADKIGEEYIIPTLGVWDSFEDIDFDSLPDQFVLKCTHDSGGLVIVRDKSKIDIEAAKKKISGSLKTNYYYHGREWPYKNVKPRIIAEQYMEDCSGELPDYKFFSFDGFTRAMFIATDRFNEGEETKFDFYDMDFQHLPFTNGHPNSEKEIKRPQSFEKMVELANELSKGIPQLRVDFYDIDGKVYFGELTFSHWSGMMPFDPNGWDETFGEWIKLPESVGGGHLVAGDGYILWVHQKESNLPVYKFFCFDGVPKIIQAIQNDKQVNESIDYFDTEWNRLDLKQNYPNSQVPLSSPENLDKMLDLVRILAKEKQGFLRVDLYQINSKLYFSEYTFYSDGGMAKFYPEKWDEILGKWITLPKTGKGTDF